MTLTAHNTSNRPVVIDDDGHVLGAGEWGQVPDSARVREAVDTGDLNLVEAAPGQDATSAATDGPAGGTPPAGRRATRKPEEA